jgi:DNA polymerase delta subunit 1
MQRDVPGAVKFVEGQIARLLSGRVESWELVMTGGLWRVTGQQLEKAAAAAAGETARVMCSLLIHLRPFVI